MENKLNTIIRFPYTNILGWSVSRYGLFTTCKRQYFYNYYSKHDSEYSRDKIEKLKKMTSIPLEIGNIVHDVIKAFLERLLKSENVLDKNKYFDYAKTLTEKYCNNKLFREKYYNEISNVNIGEIFCGVQTCLENFINSERYSWLIEKAITNKKNWIIEPEGYGETRIKELKAYCKVDFLFPVDDKIYILDWKTGKQDGIKHKKQLLGYSTWASFHLKRDPKDITSIISYLKPSYNEMLSNFNESDTREFSNSILQETNEMYAYCSNIENNKPKEKKEFSMTDNCKICEYCNFKELCGKN